MAQIQGASLSCADFSISLGMNAGVAKLVDAVDSKSTCSNIVLVRVRSPAKTGEHLAPLFRFCGEKTVRGTVFRVRNEDIRRLDGGRIGFRARDTRYRGSRRRIVFGVVACPAERSPVAGISPDKVSLKSFCPVFSFSNPLFFCRINASAGFSGVVR